MKIFLLPFLLAVCHLAALEAAPMEETEPGNRERRDVCRYGPGGQDFMCRRDMECIKASWHCDGQEDCSDGSDEEGCDTTTTTTFRPCTENCVSCPLPYRSYVGVCFYLDTEYNGLTWNDAAQKCKDKSGGTLPILYSSEIKKYVTEHNRESDIYEMYVGLTDRSVEGQWKWIDGRDYTMETSDWGTGEPNNAGWGRGEDCAEMGRNGLYNDIECDRSNRVRLMCMIIPDSSEKNKKYDIYVGLTDRSVEGQWKWIDGRDYTMVTSDWGKGEPNNAGYWGRGEDCAEMKRNGLYNDVPCGADKHVTLMCMIIPGSSVMGCPQDYTLHGTHCFYWKPYKQYMSWNEAAQQCKDKSGGTLPVLYSSEIKQYVTDQYGDD